METNCWICGNKSNDIEGCLEVRRICESADNPEYMPQNVTKHDSWFKNFIEMDTNCNRLKK